MRLTALAAIALLLSLSTLVVRTQALSNIVDLVVAVGSPYVVLLALSGLALSALCGRILLSIVAVLVVAATLAVQVPWYYFGPPAEVAQHTDIRVLSANLRKGQADASAFVGLAAANADVITVSELTPGEVRAFSRAGLDELFPYSVLIPAPGASGIGLWSRFPLTVVAKQPKNANVAARVRIPGLKLDPLLASVHITSPVARDAKSFGDWRSGIAATRARLDDFADTAGSAAVIIAGDFNSTPDMRQFRDLLTNGYRDAIEQTGAGFSPTFPSNSWLPPLITIDHVLTRNATATSIKTVNLPGTDHRSLLATVQVPVDPIAS